MSTPRRYKAFISYSHRDERWAGWLHRALESFRPPRAAAGQRPLKPIFRDRDELSASSNLSQTIENALAESENLIVVCSVSAAQSRWVNAEVEEFIRLGRDDRIFCLFVDETSPDECLPEVLRADSDSEPLGADVHADGRRGAKLKIIAGLLDVSYDTLRQRDKERRRQQTMRFSAASIAALGLVSLITYRVAVEPPCTSSAGLFAEVWNSERADSMRQAFLNADVPFANHTIKVVLDVLSEYADRWVAMHAETCEATMVRGEQSEQLMDLRMACLTDRRQRFDALATQFLEGDRTTVQNAVLAANGLGRLSRCADRTTLLAGYPAPEGAMVEAVAEARVQIAKLRALVDSSKALPALALAESTWRTLENMDYPPVQAEALVLLGRAQVLGGDRTSGQSTFIQAASRAVAANDNNLAAQAWLSIPELIREKVRGADDAKDMLALAKAYVERLPDDHPLRASYHANLGEVLVIQGEIAAGRAALQQAVAHARTTNDTKLPAYLNRLARVHAQHLEFELALPLIEESIKLSSQYFGSNHPAYAASLQTLGGMYIDKGETDKAISYIEESLKIEQLAFPEIHAKIAATYAQLGSAYFRAVKTERAEELLRKSLDIYAAVDATSPIAWGDAHNNLGNVYSHLERFDESEYHLLEASRLWESVDFYRYSVVLNNLGSMVMGKDDFAAARDYCGRALAADERQFPPDSPNIAYPLSCLGEALLNLGEFEKAVTTLRRAYDIRIGRHEAPLPMAHTRINLAMALWERGGDRQEIKEHYEFALNAVIEHNTGDEPALRSWAKGKNL